MLKDVLQKLRVSDLQNEIRKVLSDFKGFKKMKKSELIEVMLENESLFKHLDKVDTTEFKKKTVPKPKGKIQKQRAEDKPEKEKLKKEPSEYVKFVKKYRMDNNLSLKDAMKEIKEKGLYKAKTPAKPKPKLNKEEKQQKEDNSVRRGIKKKLVEYMKTVTDDPSTRDKTQFVKLKKIIGKKTAVQNKKRLLLKNKSPNIYAKLKELNFFEDIDIDKEESKQIKKIEKVKEPVKVEKVKEPEVSDDEKKLLEFKIIVEKFIKNPTEKLNDEILDKLELVDDLPKKDQDRLNKALDKFEEGEEEPEEPKKKERKKIKLVTFQEPEPKKTTNKVIQLIDNYNKLNKKYQEYAKLAHKKKYDGFKDVDVYTTENEISKFKKLIKEGKLTEKEIIDKVMTIQYTNTFGQRLPLSYFYNSTLMTVVRRTDNFLANEFNKMENTLKDLLYYNRPSKVLRATLATEGSTVANPNTLKDVEQNKERLLNSLQEEENKFETQLDRVREVENFKKDIIENFNFYNTKVTYNKTKIPDRVSKAFDKYKEIKDNSEEILDKYIEKYKKGKLFKKKQVNKKTEEPEPKEKVKKNKEFDYNYLNESLERSINFIEKLAKMIKKYNELPSKTQKEEIDTRIKFINDAPKSMKDDLNLDEFTVNTKTRKGDYVDDYKKYLKETTTLKEKKTINIMEETKQTIKYKKDNFLPLTAVQFLTKIFKISKSERGKMDINKEAELRKRWFKNYMQSQEDENGFNYEIKDWIQDTSKFLKANSDKDLEALYQKQVNKEEAKKEPKKKPVNKKTEQPKKETKKYKYPFDISSKEVQDDNMEIEDLIKKNKELLSKVYISRIGFKGKGRVRDINFLSYINIRLNESGLPPKEAKETSSYRLFQIKDLLKQLKNLKVGGEKSNDKEFKIGELIVLVPIKK